MPSEWAFGLGWLLALACDLLFRLEGVRALAEVLSDFLALAVALAFLLLLAPVWELVRGAVCAAKGSTSRSAMGRAGRMAAGPTAGARSYRPPAIGCRCRRRWDDEPLPPHHPPDADWTQAGAGRRGCAPVAGSARG